MQHRIHKWLGIIQGVDRKVVPFDPTERAKRNAALARAPRPVRVKRAGEPWRSMRVQTGPEAA